MLVSLPDKYCVSLTGTWELIHSFCVKLAGNVTRPDGRGSSDLTFDPHASDAPLSSPVQKISDKHGNKILKNVAMLTWVEFPETTGHNMTGLALEPVPHLP